MDLGLVPTSGALFGTGTGGGGGRVGVAAMAAVVVVTGGTFWAPLFRETGLTRFPDFLRSFEWRFCPNSGMADCGLV